MSERADLKLWVIDSASDEEVSDIGVGDMVILNKSDLIPDNLTKWINNQYENNLVFSLSLTTKNGLQEVIDAIADRVTKNMEGTTFPAATRQRHFTLLEEAIAQLQLAEAMVSKVPELASENIRSALKCFDGLFGRYDIESVLGRIFSNFCIGK
jgi:tRNA modification GTPase